MGAARSRAPGGAPGARRWHPRDRVVHRPDDRAIVRQQQVGDPAEPLERLLRGQAHRLLGEVAAGADDRPAARLDEEMVQRRVGQHHAEPGVPGRDRGSGQRRICTPAEEQDRRRLGDEDPRSHRRRARRSGAPPRGWRT